MGNRKHPPGPNEMQETLFKPNASWIPPKSFPNLNGVKRIGLDIESKDPDLIKRGPGFIRGDAEVVGISISTDDASWYFPYRHFSGGNINPASVIAYTKDLLKRDDLLVIGANLQYELEGLHSDGIKIAGKMYDVQIADALINEERDDGYALQDLAKIYGLPLKDESLLKEAATAYDVDPKGGLWKLHSKYVGAYAEWDSRLPLKIADAQAKLIRDGELEQIITLEHKLLPILWEMRKRGVRVDLEKAKKLSGELKVKEDIEYKTLSELAGGFVDVFSGPDLANLCDRMKIHYNRTGKGNASFTADFLEASTHPVLQQVVKVRKLQRLRTTFVDDWIFKNQIKGRIHPQWKQLMSDEGGTRTGRMAASNPNPQQVPARSELAPLVRALFIPEDGMRWGKYDYSQQEPRLLVHYASLCKLTGADLVKMAYVNNPMMDIYQFLATSCNMKRRDAKDATLGRMYNMGADKFASKQNISVEEAKSKLKQFDESVPFVRELGEYVMGVAQRRGDIKTLLGRRRHFNYWEPVDAFDRKRKAKELREKRLPIPPELNTIPVNSVEEAKEKWGNIRFQRAHTHKALNSLIQGSAADMTKAAVVQRYYDFGDVPHLVVHDEGDYSVGDDKHANSIKDTYEGCVTLQVPVKCEMEVGDHWK